MKAIKTAALAAIFAVGAAVTTPAMASAQGLPPGYTMEQIQALINNPIDVQAGQTTNMSLPAPVEAHYSGGGWNVNASGGSLSIAAPAEGGQIAVPVEVYGHYATVTLQATAVSTQTEENSGAGTDSTDQQRAPHAEVLSNDPAAASSSAAQASAGSLPEVEGVTPERKLAEELNTAQTENIYLESKIEGQTITVSFGFEQALEFYNRFGNLDQAQYSVRYIDGKGQLIEGIKRDVDTANRKLILTYPEGQAPDNPFIMQLVRKSDSVVEVQATLRDPNFASKDNISAEELKAEQEAAAQQSRGLNTWIFALAGGVVALLVIVALAVFVLRRRR